MTGALMNGTATALQYGFENKGAIWKANRLYYFGTNTGISYGPDARYPNLYRVVYPDGAVSADFYNLSRVRQRCREAACALYPRSEALSPERLH